MMRAKVSTYDFEDSLVNLGRFFTKGETSSDLRSITKSGVPHMELIAPAHAHGRSM